jgi:UDP-N-acetylmuramate--alanine ligase
LKILDRPLKIYFSGIGGSGVSAIAHFISAGGNMVYGSDRAFDSNPAHPSLGLLRNNGIRIVKQDGLAMDSSFDLAVFSTAVEKNQPEFGRAKDLHLPIRTRPEFLADIVSEFDAVAVAGTSGKSTASGMLAFLMKELGLRPNFIGGGRVKQFMSETNPGNSIAGKSRNLVFEACESDGSIINYKPLRSIVLNLALDHQLPEKTKEMFSCLIANTNDFSIINGDDKELVSIAPHAVAYSINNPTKYKAENIRLMPFCSEFALNGTRFELFLPGMHNILNALASIALLSEMGIELERIAPALRSFKGIERRFDVLLNENHHLVIDDYAHSPHKIAALMKTMSNIIDSVFYIFQPHGFSPTRLMKDEYIRVFRENLRNTDHLAILPIYYAGGSVARDISSEALAEGMGNGVSVEVVSDRQDILRRVDKWNSYVVFGARDETLADFAWDIAKAVMSNE